MAGLSGYDLNYKVFVEPKASMSRPFQFLRIPIVNYGMGQSHNDLGEFAALVGLYWADNSRPAELTAAEGTLKALKLLQTRPLPSGWSSAMKLRLCPLPKA
jgi:hypothetical protein